uniref:Uncharacterized protein n=1 Tax=Clytia hemisphaerica TaxID=252671 RepID=A0A7M5WV00_9CNID
MNSFGMLAIIVQMFWMNSVNAEIGCYQCQLGNGGCINPIEAEPPIRVEYCTGNKVCSTETRYARQNSSIPFDEEPVFIQRTCQSIGSPMCDFTKEKPCIKDQNNENMYVCYSCCSNNKCNTDVPVFSHASKNALPVLVITFCSVILSAILFH